MRINKGKYALTNGIILNGQQDMVPQTDKIILVSDKVIEAIVDKGQDISGYEVIDLRGAIYHAGID